jgi:hypothetical protein
MTPYVLVVSLLKQDAMCALFFAHLQQRAPIRIVQFGRDPLAGALSGASALIVIRGLFEFGNLIECAGRLGIPRYYFLDDNFMLIREEVERYGSSYDLYTNDRVRDTLSGFEGVLLAAPSLIDYFRDHHLHPALSFYPPVAGPVVAAPPAAGQPLTIAFFGGAHRREPFLRLVYPALCRLAAERPIRLLAAGIDDAAMTRTAGVDIVHIPYNPSYDDALRAVASHAPDILVHPSDGTANNIFKNPHVLINARAIGATPVFSDAPPYQDVEVSGVALTAIDTADSWYAALSTLAGDATRRQDINRRLSAYCDTHFGGDRNLAIVNNILAAHRPPAWPVAAARLAVAAPWLIAGRVRKRILK